MVVAIVWILLAFLVGFAGSGKKIGYGGTFVLSLILSPLVGLIVALVSDPATPDNSAVMREYNQWVNQATAHMKMKETQAAINALHKALEFFSGNAAVYFNLACLHSELHQREEAYHNLTTAVSKGYVKLDNINSDPTLGWLRTQDDWNSFVQNGYKRVAGTQPVGPSKADQLEKLARLKSEGHLTEMEFEAEKRKLLA